MEKPTTRIHPETGEILRRDIRLDEFSHKGETLIIIDVPGWYPDDDSDAIFSWDDLYFYDAALEILKERVRMREEAAQNLEAKLA